MVWPYWKLFLVFFSKKPLFQCIPYEKPKTASVWVGFWDSNKDYIGRQVCWWKKTRTGFQWCQAFIDRWPLKRCNYMHVSLYTTTFVLGRDFLLCVNVKKLRKCREKKNKPWKADTNSRWYITTVVCTYSTVADFWHSFVT